MKKKLFSLCLALMLLVSVLPLGASASGVWRQGTCGENLTWEQYRDGTLVISGTGPMDDFWVPPWYSYEKADQVTGIVISEGVTYIGHRAFLNCDDVTEIVIPQSVTAIGEEAFFACEGLTELVIPSSVEVIGTYAFISCKGLKRMVIPESVREMGGAVFSGCTKLKEIIFLGDAPAFSEYSRWKHTLGTFQDVSAEVFYPEDNDTWTRKILRKDYDGDIEWVPMTREELSQHTLPTAAPPVVNDPPQVPAATNPPQIATTDEEILRALTSLLVGMHYDSSRSPGNTGDWTDENVAWFIYGKLMWDDYTYSPDSFLKNAGLSIGSGDDFMWHYDLDLIQKITMDALGREYPESCSNELLYVEGNELVAVPSAGESTRFIIQDFVRHGDQIIALGLSTHVSGIGSVFQGYFQAVFDVNPASLYGFTLVSLKNVSGGQFYRNLGAFASSALEEPGITHWPKHVLDGDKGTAWVEAVSGVGEGEWITLQTNDGSQMVVTALEFDLGYQLNEDILKKNGWPYRVRVRCEDGYQEEFEFYSLADMAVLKQAVTTSWIEITIVEATAGYKYEDTCISEIRVRGYDTQAHLNGYTQSNDPVYHSVADPTVPSTEPATQAPTVPSTEPATHPSSEPAADSGDEEEDETSSGSVKDWLPFAIIGVVAVVTGIIVILMLNKHSRNLPKDEDDIFDM